MDYYYELPKGKRWMDDGSDPETIHGRDTDVSQLHYSLESMIKDIFPVNCVPVEVADKLERLRTYLDTSEALIQEIIKDVSAVIGAQL